MKTLYLDCFSGISGDMFLGTLIDLGLDLELLNRELAGLGENAHRVSAREVTRGGLRGIHCEVHAGTGKGLNNLPAIEAALGDSRLADAVKERSRNIFRSLAATEGELHGKDPEEIHFHELGAVDTLVDVVGACIGLEALEIEKLLCSPLNLGSGTVKAEHGTLPVPSPAAAALLRGRSVYSSGLKGELVTPTGAAVVAALAEESSTFPPMAVDRIGYGAGTREYADHPNLLRGFLGDLKEASIREERVVVIETTIDDMNPQNYVHLMDRLFEDGAREVFLTPVIMKKNRPGTLVTIIVPGDKMQVVTRRIFEETTTIGFRFKETDRIELEQRIVPVSTRFGRIGVKASSYQGEVMQATPEFDDCRRAARDRRVPLKQVQEEALAAYRAAKGKKK